MLQSELGLVVQGYNCCKLSSLMGTLFSILMLCILAGWCFCLLSQSLA